MFAQEIRNETICVELQATTYSAIAQRSYNVPDRLSMNHAFLIDKSSSRHYWTAAYTTSIVTVFVAVIVAAYVVLNPRANRTTLRYRLTYVLTIVVTVISSKIEEGGMHGQFSVLIVKAFFAAAAVPLLSQISFQLADHKIASHSTIILNLAISSLLYLLGLVSVDHRSILSIRTIAAIALTSVNLALSKQFDHQMLGQFKVTDAEKASPHFAHIIAKSEKKGVNI